MIHNVQILSISRSVDKILSGFENLTGLKQTSTDSTHYRILNIRKNRYKNGFVLTKKASSKSKNCF